jgi:hypothetical protein
LNLGVSGLVKDKTSFDYMRQNYKIGDIIDVIIAEDFDASLCIERPLISLTLPLEIVSPPKSI